MMDERPIQIVVDKASKDGDHSAEIRFRILPDDTFEVVSIKTNPKVVP